MVLGHDGQRFTQPGNWLENAHPDAHVVTHHRRLAGVKFPRLIENAGWRSYLADVVQQSATMHDAKVVLRHSQGTADLEGELGYSLGMPRSPRGLGVNGTGQSGQSPPMQLFHRLDELDVRKGDCQLISDLTGLLEVFRLNRQRAGLCPDQRRERLMLQE